jgi:hypothetical protein
MARVREGLGDNLSTAAPGRAKTRATTAKATTFFIMLGSHFSLMDRDSTIISTTQRAEGTTPDRGRYTAGVSFRVEPAYGTLVA